MTLPNTPSTPPSQTHENRQQRPDLHVVRDTDVVPPETDTEITGPVPVVDADGQPVTPQAPLDIRIRESVLSALQARPRFSTRPASFAESIAYSQTGDWAASDNGAKRAAHGLATVIAYVVTYPLDLVLQARAKPIGFVLVLALIVILTKLL